MGFVERVVDDIDGGGVTGAVGFGREGLGGRHREWRGGMVPPASGREMWELGTGALLFFPFYYPLI